MRRKRTIKNRYLLSAIIVAGAGIPLTQRQVEAISCPELRIVFARGSGGERWHDQNYLEFKSTIESKLKTADVNYEFIDLDYPAVGVGVDNLGVTMGAFFGAGDAYEFGASVNTGVENLQKMVNGTSCPNTSYVIGGYSQGAMVVSKALKNLNASRIIYAATFGDPKLYLPEGKGVMPAACKGQNLSDYRMYVPDCQAYKGLLGAYIPYEPDSMARKTGTWCNKRDIFCSSHLSVSDHISYVSDNLYEDASRVIFDKICQKFKLENRVSSPHDTAILIDSTGSMGEMIDKYKSEAMRLARETLDSGGRVALYDYRDLGDPYQPVQHCDFETCTLEKFATELATIETNGGGDTPESLLSAAFHTMSSLKWKYGSTKSLVVLTDANFLAPDRDGMTFDEVVRLSKTIDPVNFYIITDGVYENDYAELAEVTGGKVVTNFDELSLLTDYIMERYDSLPRVEEDTVAGERPVLTVTSIKPSGDGVDIEFENTGTKAIVALNDKILGITDEKNVFIQGLSTDIQSTITLIPINDEIRGEPASIEIDLPNITGKGSTDTVASDIGSDLNASEAAIKKIKAPQTGKR